MIKVFTWFCTKNDSSPENSSIHYAVCARHTVISLFRRAAPFVEYLSKNKKTYYKVTKKKDRMIFSHMVSFCNTGGWIQAL